MNKNTLWTVLAVAIAVILAWVLVEVVFKLAWILVKVGVVAVVAIGLFLVIRMLFSRSE